MYTVTLIIAPNGVCSATLLDVRRGTRPDGSRVVEVREVPDDVPMHQVLLAASETRWVSGTWAYWEELGPGQEVRRGGPRPVGREWKSRGTITLTRDAWAIAERLGDGNRSAGVEKALKRAKLSDKK